MKIASKPPRNGGALVSAVEGRLTGIINLIRQRLASSWRYAHNLQTRDTDGTDVEVNLTSAAVAKAILDTFEDGLDDCGFPEEKTGALLQLMQLEIPETPETEIVEDFYVDVYSAYEHAMDRLTRLIADWASRLRVTYYQGEVVVTFSGDRPVATLNGNGTLKWHDGINNMEAYYWGTQ